MKPRIYIVEVEFVDGSARFCANSLAQANHYFSWAMQREGVISVSLELE